MRILILIEELNGGGKERRLFELLKGLSRDANFDVHLALTKKQNDYPYVNDLPITIHRVYGFSNIALIGEYKRLFDRLRPEVVHAWSYKTSFYASLFKMPFRFKFIAGFIGDTFGLFKWKAIVARYIIFNQADFVVGNSRAGLLAYRVPKKKGRVIYNGFDPARISTNRESKLKEIGVSTPLKVVMLANVTPYKNYPLFIDLARKVTSQRDDVTFISIGKILPEFEALTAPYVGNKHPRVKFLGFRSDAEELIKDCDVGLLCTYSEGISNAIIELMANGVPVITNDTQGGSKEIIDNQETGIICTDDELIAQLQRLLSDAGLRAHLSNNAKNKILHSWSLNAMVIEYIKLYKRI